MLVIFMEDSQMSNNIPEYLPEQHKHNFTQSGSV